jgi:hypothetical protein
MMGGILALLAAGGYTAYQAGIFWPNFQLQLTLSMSFKDLCR